MFELPSDQSLDGSLGSSSRETMNSLAMAPQILKGAISDLSEQSSYEYLKIVTKALPSKVTERLFKNASELILNEAAGFLDFSINFTSIVDEVIKRITKLPFTFY